MKKPPSRQVVAEGQFVAALVAAVDDEIGARRDALVDVAADPVQGGLVDQRPVVGLGVQAVADPQMLDAFGEPGASRSATSATATATLMAMQRSPALP